jgi:hypothetical protein
MTTLVTLGPEGSFSDLCAKTYFKDARKHILIHMTSMFDVRFLGHY